MNNLETSKEYVEFLESLLIEELIKEFDFNCQLAFIGKKRFGGSNTTVYYFKDEMGITWERSIPDRMFCEIAFRNPKCRARLVK